MLSGLWRFVAAQGSRPRSGIAATLLLTLISPAPATQAALAPPAYPLVAIATEPRNLSSGATLSPTGWVNMTVDDVHRLRMVYGSDVASRTDKPVQLVRDFANRVPDTTPVLPYMGGYTTNLAPDAQLAQTTYIKGVAMTRVGELSADSGTDDTIEVKIVLSGRLKSVDLASTRARVLIPRKDNPDEVKAPGQWNIIYNVSDQYDSWLRVGDELMQIKNVSYTYVGGANPVLSATVEVVRGYKGTAVVNHIKGRRILSPVYLGDNIQTDDRFTQSYPDNPSTSSSTIRYAIDPGSEVAENLRAKIINDFASLPAPRKPYDGAWWDTFNAQFYNMCDASGNPVRPFEIWNFQSHANYTEGEFLDMLQLFTQEVRGKLTGSTKILYANTGVDTYLLGSAAGTETFVNSPGVTQYLDGACFEDSFLKWSSSAENFNLVGGADWLSRIQKMIEACIDQRAHICMAGPAGDLAGRVGSFNNPSLDYLPKMRYAYASYLMAVNVRSGLGQLSKDISLSFGLPLFVQKSSGGLTQMLPLDSMFFAPIGNPKIWVNSAKLSVAYTNPGDPNRGLKLGSVYVREFGNGFAAVYPAASGTGTSQSITPPPPPNDKVWKYAHNGGAVSVPISLAPGDGIILVAQ